MSVHTLTDLISRALRPESVSLQTAEGIIAPGYDTRIDELRSTLEDATSWLSEYTADLITQTSISTLKIRYSNLSGYSIEIPHSQKGKIPEFFIHKTTLTNTLRYTTPELTDFENRLSTAQNELFEREAEIFSEICGEVGKYFDEIKQISSEIGVIDFLYGGAKVAYENGYTKPILTDQYSLSIEGGRHGIVEKIEKDFISNSLSLDETKYIHLISGPNMGGKSTFLRQNALIILQAHMGYFVPAQKAIIPLTDKIFSRIGASDNLFDGASTFMMEMQEVAYILHNATKKSFLIIDEIGRGTSTYDGLSLAWSILRYIHDEIGAKTLFATHYHELVDEATHLQHVVNFSVWVLENEDNIIFLRKIIPGSMKKSYGIHVAGLAGLPKKVLTDAKNFLKTFEHPHGIQLSLSVPAPEKQTPVSHLEEKIKTLDLNNMTPFQALSTLQDLQKKL